MEKVHESDVIYRNPKAVARIDTIWQQIQSFSKN